MPVSAMVLQKQNSFKLVSVVCRHFLTLANVIERGYKKERLMNCGLFPEISDTFLGIVYNYLRSAKGTEMKIAIVGKKTETANYARYIQAINITPAVTLNIEEVSACDALLLPGGGDITPAFFGEQNHGSRNIDTELDIRQLLAFDLAVKSRQPVLGICKGMQIINVGLGGKLIQDLSPSASERHSYENGDKYHTSVITCGSWLSRLYGQEACVNSAHHQALNSLGRGLEAVQYCPLDGCIEGIAHKTLPVIGVQWHPERIDCARSGTDGRKVLAYFVSLISKTRS